MMPRVEIELRLPFEENLARAFALPASPDRPSDAEIAGALRRLYELAHGRSVSTTLGLIPIAPAVAPFLSRRRFSVATRSELLRAVEHQTAITSEKASSAEASQSNSNAIRPIYEKRTAPYHTPPSPGQPRLP